MIYANDYVSHKSPVIIAISKLFFLFQGREGVNSSRLFFDRAVVTTKIRAIVTKPLLFRYESPVTTKMSKKNRDELIRSLKGDMQSLKQNRLILSFCAKGKNSVFTYSEILVIL